MGGPAAKKDDWGSLVPARRAPPASAALGGTENRAADGACHERNDDRRRCQVARPGGVSLGPSRERRLVRMRFTSSYKENLYGSSKSTFAAGVLGPAPIPTLRLSLVDCEIWYPRPKLKVP